ncbi:hypothetical protein MHU86_10437 [Fragilaria crotonensis]|nr:hypothetical protein MHU86_10437 [Fragilaria crotonensis]
MADANTVHTPPSCRTSRNLSGRVPGVPPRKALFFGFQNALRRAIQTRYHQVKGFYNRSKKTKLLSAQLPKELHNRLDSLIARDIAALLWRTKTTIPIPQSVTFELKQLHQHLADITRPWSISIGHVVPRVPQFTSLGDACRMGGGAFCHELKFWFDIVWSPQTRALFDEGRIHINLLEFTVVLLQLAAAIVRSEDTPAITSMPPLSKLLIRTDNSPSRNWAHKYRLAPSEANYLSVYMHRSSSELNLLSPATMWQALTTPSLTLYRAPLNLSHILIVANRFFARSRGSSLITFSTQV